MKKRIASIFLCLCMIVEFLPSVALADTSSKESTITIGTSALQRKDLLYYGTCTPDDSLIKDPDFKQGNMAWYVLSAEHTNATNLNATTIPNNQYNDTDGIFLLAKEPVYFCKFIGTNNEVYSLDSTRGEIWYNSQIRTWLSGTFYNGAFSKKEQQAVRAVSTEDGRPQAASSMDAITIRSANLNQEKVFLLSYDEATNPDFFDVIPGLRASGVTDPVLTCACPYFLRSSVYSPIDYEGSDYKNSALYLMLNGNWNEGTIAQQLKNQTVNGPKGVRPAMNLTKSNILFCSKAVDGKSAGVVTSLSAPATESNVTEWKTTLSDITKSLTVNSCTRKGDSVTVSYSGATTGANHYLSAIVTNSTDTEITYYGKVAALSDEANAAGSVTFGLDSKVNNISFFVEEDNGNYKTDYASQPQKVTIGVVPNITTATLPDGVKGESYSVGLASDGANITWGMQGENNLLPSSLTLNSATGVISGTPDAAGTTTFTCTATNQYGTDTKTFSITIYPPANRTVSKDADAKPYTLKNERLQETGNSVHAAVGDTITVIPQTGYLFTALSLSTDVSMQPGAVATDRFTKNNDGSYSFTMLDQDESVNATLVGYTLGCVSDENGTVVASYSVNGGASVPITFGETIVPVGAAVTINGTGNTGYRLDTRYPLVLNSSYYTYSSSMALNPKVSISSNPFTFTMPQANVTLHPVFVTAADVLNFTVTAPSDATLNETKTVATVTGGTVTASYQKNAFNQNEPVVFGETAIPLKTPITVTFTPDEGYSMVPGRVQETSELITSPVAGCYCYFAEYGIDTGTALKLVSESPMQISFPWSIVTSFEEQCEINLYAEFTSEPLSAPIINFTTQPQNAQMTAGTTPSMLHAAATVTPSGTAVLNWYACDAQGAISGESLGVGDDFTIPTGLAQGTYYYLCRASCDGATTVDSNVATVTINTAPATTYTISASADPTMGGTVTGCGTYNENATVTMEATSNSGYHFVKWTEDGTQVSTSAKYTFTATADRTLVAVFEADTTPTVTSVDVTPATANVEKNKTQQFNATVSGTGNFNNTVNWTVEGGVTGTTISTSGLLTVAAEETATSLTVKATATGDNTKTGTATVAVTSAPVTKYTLTVTNGSGDGDYESGALINIFADAPASGKQFKNWTTSDGGSFGNANITATTYTMPAGAATVTANYEDIPSTFVAVTGITGVPTTATAGTNLTLTGTVAPATATNKTIAWSVKNAGSTGATISGSTLSTTAAGTVKVTATITNGATESTNYTQDFDIVVSSIPATTYAVTVNGSYATTTGAGSYAKDATVNIYAGNRSNYSFTGWTVVSGGVAITNASSENASFTMPDNAVTVKANWNYNGGGGGGGSVGTDYYYTKGTNGTWAQSTSSGLSFTVNASYSKFSSIRVDDTTVASSNYTVASGSTIVTLKPAYLKTLSVGVHALCIVFTDGTATTNFTITNGEHSNPQTGVDFDDVNETDWFYDNVAYVFEKGMMQGTGSKLFSPYTFTTRGMIVSVLYRLEGEPTVSGSNPFDDVKSGSYYENAITWAQANKIVDGYGNAKFGPDDHITREQMAAILYRYAQNKGYDVSVGEDTNILSYTDSDQISEYAIPAMQWACGAGLMNGSGGKLMPQGEANRAQVAAIFNRFCENVAK